MNEEWVLEFLAGLMAQWPKSSEAEASEELLAALSDDFQAPDLANKPNTEFSILSRVLIRGNMAIVMVYDPSEPEYPNRAVIRLNSKGELKLCSFKFQCLSCFGPGIDADAGPCEVCAATGWGLA